VLAYVVRWKIAGHILGAFTSMSLDLNNPVSSDANSATRIYRGDTLGMLVNVDQRHWVAFRVYDNVIWLLDSEKARPLSYSFSDFQSYLHRNKAAFCVTDVL
jgi:hypothetical protein